MTDEHYQRVVRSVLGGAEGAEDAGALQGTIAAQDETIRQQRQLIAKQQATLQAQALLIADQGAVIREVAAQAEWITKFFPKKG